MAKIVISLTARDRTKRTKIWDHMGINITYWTILGLERESQKKIIFKLLNFWQKLLSP